MPKPKITPPPQCPVCSRPRARNAHGRLGMTCGDDGCRRERMASRRGTRWSAERKIAARDARRRRRRERREAANGPVVELRRGDVPIFPKIPER